MGQGYREMFTSVFVAEDDAFDYAIERCVQFVPKAFAKSHGVRKNSEKCWWSGFIQKIGFGRIDEK